MRLFIILFTGILMACSADTTNTSSAPEPAMNLAGSEWNLGDGSKAFVAFKPDGKVIGSGGCNNFSGQFTQNDNSIEIGPLAATKKMCPPDIMEIENRLFMLLDSASFLQASHLNLTLMDSDRTELATLNRSDWD